MTSGTIDSRRPKRRARWMMGGAALLTLVAAASSSGSPSAGAAAPSAGAVAKTAPGAVDTSAATPGVTATTVTVGQVDDLTLPLPGLFKGAEDGTQAYFDYINSLGGVNGRTIKLDAQDSGYSPGTVAATTASQIQNDFALVGGFSLDDSAEEPLIQAAGMPDVAYPL